MTVGGIVICVMLTSLIMIGVAYGFMLFGDGEHGKGIARIIISGILIAGVWIGGSWYYNNTESGKRAMKSQESNFNGGITREVKVYDMQGDLIETYKGKFDVEHENDKILFDDENGHRHIIYYTTGTVVVDEVEE